jgi:NAD(P)-dependent dehydrogenase (short-subunit alcohol dehydrogenase family)
MLTAGVELAPHDILVVGVGPGAVITPINLPTLNDSAELAKVKAALPLGRWPNRKKSPAWSHSSLATAPPTSRPPPSSPTAA